jgi:hypothetical protein
MSTRIGESTTELQMDPAPAQGEAPAAESAEKELDRWRALCARRAREERRTRAGGFDD